MLRKDGDANRIWVLVRLTTMSDCGCTSLHHPLSEATWIFWNEIFVSFRVEFKRKYFFDGIGLLQPQDAKLRIYAAKLPAQQTLPDSFRETFQPHTQPRSLSVQKRSENLKWKNHLLLKKLTSAENGKSINLKRAWWYSFPSLLP